MNFLLKLRPGSFGLLIAALVISSFATSVTKQSSRNHTPAHVDIASPTASGTPSSTAEATSETEAPITYLEYQIDIELQNLLNQIKAESRDRLDQGVTIEQVNGALAALASEPATPETTARKLYLLRTMQTLKDGIEPPTAEPSQVPTVEGYQDVIGQ